MDHTAAVDTFAEMQTDNKVANFLEVCDLCGLDHASQQCPQLAETGRPDAAISLAEMTLPKGFYVTTDSSGMPQISSLEALPAMAKIGPFEAKRTLLSLENDAGFVLRVFRPDDECVTLDTSNENWCNWLCFVPTASTETEQNLMALQLDYQIFYLTTRAIPSGEYLKVWYAPHYAKKLGKPAKPDGGRTSTLLSLSRGARLVTTTGAAAPSGSVVEGPVSEESQLAVTSIKTEHILETKEEIMSELDAGGSAVNASKRVWKCKECGSSFSGPRGLGKHKRDVHGSSLTQSAFSSQLQVSPTPAQSLRSRSSVSQLPTVFPLQSAVETEIRPTVETEIRPTVETDSRPAVETEIRPTVETDIRPTVETDIRPAVEADIRPTVETDFRPAVETDIRPAVETDIRPTVETDIRPPGELCIAHEEQDVGEQLPSGSATGSATAARTPDIESQAIVARSSLLSVQLPPSFVGRLLTAADHAALGIKPCFVLINAVARKLATAKLSSSKAATRGSSDGAAKASDRAKKRIQPPKRLLDSDSIAMDTVSSSNCDRSAYCTAEEEGTKEHEDGDRPESCAPEEAGLQGKKQIDGDRPAACVPEQVGGNKHKDCPASCLPEEAGGKTHDDGHCSESCASEEAGRRKHKLGTRGASCAPEEAGGKKRKDGHCEQPQMRETYCEIICTDTSSPTAGSSQNSVTNAQLDAPFATTADYAPPMPRSATLGSALSCDERPAQHCGDCGVIFPRDRSLTHHQCSTSWHSSNVALYAATLDGLNAFRKDGAYFCPECLAEASLTSVAACQLVDPAVCSEAAMKLSIAIAQAATTSASALFQSAAELQQHLVGHSTHFRCDVCLRQIAVANALEHCQTCTGPSDVMGPETNCEVAFESGNAALSCEYCPVTFKHSEYLDRHTLMHLGAYQCNRCHEGFCGRFLLLQHLAVCNQLQMICLLGQDAKACNDCRIPFITCAAMNTHVAICPSEQYVCRRCDVRFSSKLLFEDHSCIRVITCKICQQKFHSPEAFQQHAASHDARFLCTVCSRKFSRRQDFVKHHIQCEGRRMLQEDGIIKCSTCLKTYQDLNEYQSHAMTHAQPYLCSNCGYCFSRKISFMQHEKSCLRIRYNKPSATSAAAAASGSEAASASTYQVLPFAGEAAAQRTNEEASVVVASPAFAASSTAVGEANLASASAAIRSGAASTSMNSAGDSAAPSRKKNKQKSSNEDSNVVEAFECILCGRLYNLKSSLKKHLKTHGQRQFRCPACHKMFYEHHAMQMHYDSVHTGLLCATCKHCGKEFRTKYTMLEHIRQFHTAESEQYSCDHCGKSFRQRGNLRKHQLKHESKHRYECKSCKLTFRYPEQYRRHGVLHEQGRTLSCNFCERKFVLHHELHKHERDFHCTDVYVCPLCGEICRWRHTIRRHIKRKHPDHGLPLDSTEFIDSLMHDVNQVERYAVNNRECPPCPEGTAEASRSGAEADAPPHGRKRGAARKRGSRRTGSPRYGRRRAAAAAPDTGSVPVDVQLGTVVQATNVVSAEGLASAAACRLTSVENSLGSSNGPCGGVAQAVDVRGNDMVTTGSAGAHSSGTAAPTAARFPPTRSLLGSAAVAAAAAAAATVAAAAGTPAAPTARGLLLGAARPSLTAPAAAVSTEAADEKLQFDTAPTARLVTEDRPVWSTAPTAGYVSAAARAGGNAAWQWEGQLPESAIGDTNESEPLLPFGDLVSYISPMETSEPGEVEAALVPSVIAPEMTRRGTTINIFTEEGAPLTPECAEALRNTITHNLPSLVTITDPVVLTIGGQRFTITVTADSEPLPDTVDQSE